MEMSSTEIFDKLQIEKKLLDVKKQQTEYKIKYVVEYIKLWLIISSERSSIKNINFIDCMCNAGIYEDGDLGTSIEVLLLFKERAKLHPEKTYNLFLNDCDHKRIDIIKSLISLYIADTNNKNLKIYVSNKDVNDYLQQYDIFNQHLKYNASTVLFVDPYDFGTVIIDRMVNFLNEYYCELIFNFFSSDYVRNGLDNRIRNCVGNAKIQNKDDLIHFIGKSFRTGRITHVFSYKFKTSTNTELYQIIFATPSDKGLDVLKQSLWKVFNGKFNHRNYERNDCQLSLFTVDDEKQSLLSMHAREAKAMLIKKYQNTTVPYSVIESFLAEKTMMKTSQFLSSVVKPLLSEGYIKKCGCVTNKSNFKKDSYAFVKE